jgi:hypothetical protein
LFTFDNLALHYMKTNQFSWRPIYVAYLLVFLSIILLFFAGGYEAWFATFIREVDLPISVNVFTLHKLILMLMDTSMLIIAFSKVQNEDERTEKIRNFANRNALLLMLGTIIYAGIFATSYFDLLLYTAFILAYHILIFQLCVYRDPVFVYMNDEQLALYAKTKMKKFNFYSFIIWGFINGGLMGIGDKHPGLYGITSLAAIYLLVVIRTVYYCWKG